MRICGAEHDSEFTPDDCLRKPGHDGLHTGWIGVGWTDEESIQPRLDPREAEPDGEEEEAVQIQALLD